MPTSGSVEKSSGFELQSDIPISHPKQSRFAEDSGDGNINRGTESAYQNVGVVPSVSAYIHFYRMLISQFSEAVKSFYTVLLPSEKRFSQKQKPTTIKSAPSDTTLVR